MGNDEVLVVAAGFAYPRQYLALSAYVCQLGRSFRKDVAGVAFYADGAIKPHVATIRYWEDGVLFSQDEAARRRTGADVEQHVARVIMTSLRNGSWAEGDRGQVFLLSGPDDPDTIRLERSILNDTVSPRSGRSCAWVQGQRYVPLSELTRPGVRVTSDLHT